MSSRRVLKAAEAVREVVSMAILTELRDYTGIYWTTFSYHLVNLIAQVF